MARPRDPMNLAYIMSTDAIDKSARQDAHVSTTKAKQLGVLTRTTIPSSVVKQVLFARIRRMEPDILCVKTRSFEILSVDANFHLKLVASCDDIDGFIVTALVLPDLSSPEVGKKDWTKKQQVPDIKLYQVPPQIIAFTLQRDLERTLVLTFAYMDCRLETQFAFHRSPLPSHGNNTIGKHMAVDPRARMLAIGAQTGTFMLVKIKDRQEIREQVETNDSIDAEKFDPIVEARMTEIKGVNTIWHMDFVSPPVDQSNSAFLVVVAEMHAGRVFLVFKVDCTRSLKVQDLKPVHTINLGTSGIPGLDKTLFIIPLKYHAGLFLFAEKHLVLILDIRNPRFEQHSSCLEGSDTEGIDDPGDYWPWPLHTTWSRPFRRKTWYKESNREIVYLCREDGQIKHLCLTVYPGRRSRVDATLLGHIHYHVDKAFAAIDLPGKDFHDSFITGGSHSNGASIVILPTQRPEVKLVIPNSNPVIDFAVMSSPINGTSEGDRIFATTNRGRIHGAISEMRYGHELKVIEEITPNEDVMEIAHLAGTSLGYLIISTPSNGRRLQVLRQQTSDSSLVDQKASTLLSSVKHEFDSLNSAIQGDDFLAMALIGDGNYVRVTSKSIRKSSLDLREWKDLVLEGIENSQILKASIDSFNGKVLYVVATATAYELHLLDVRGDSSRPLCSPSFSSEPASICMYTDEERTFAVVSTQEGNLDFYQPKGLSLVRCESYSLHQFDGICEDITVLNRTHKFPDHHSLSLLCGLRSGHFKAFDLEFGAEGLVIRERDSVTLGSTSVHMVARHISNSLIHGTTSIVIIFCENNCYLYDDTGQKFSDRTLRQLWFTDHRSATPDLDKLAGCGMGLYQSEILSIATMPPWSFSQSPIIESENEGAREGMEPHPDDIFCVTRSGILRCQLNVNERPRNIPWQIPVGGHPVRVIWSAHHKRLVVGVLIDLVIDPSPEARTRDNKKTTFAAIKIIDPRSDTSQLRPESRDQIRSLLSAGQCVPDVEEFVTVIDPSGERISGLAEWQIIARGKKYHMLLVSTLQHIRMYNFQAADGLLELKATVSDQSKEPILGLAVYDSTSFVTLTKSNLVMYKIDEYNGKVSFRQTIRKSLGSNRGSRHISIQKPQIIIGTLQHGMQIFELQNNTFEHVLSDTTGGLSYDVATLQGSFIQTAERIAVQVRHPIRQGERDTQIIGHLLPSVTPSSTPNQLTPLFQVPLPGHITRLQKISACSGSDKETHYRLLASALDGTFHTLTILPYPTLRILRLLQNLIQHERKTLCPFLSETADRHLGIIPVDKGSASRSVNGDILARLLALADDEAVSFVQRLLNGSDDMGKMDDIKDCARDWMVDLVGTEGIEKAGGLAEALIELARDIVDAL